MWSACMNPVDAGDGSSCTPYLSTFDVVRTLLGEEGLWLGCIQMAEIAAVSSAAPPPRRRAVSSLFMGLCLPS